MKWIPTSVQLPRELDIVEVCIQDHSGCYAQTRAYMLGKMWYEMEWKIIPPLNYIPTHWRRLNGSA